MAREVSFPFFMFIWGYKLLAYTKSLSAGVYEIPMLVYTKSPEKVKASLFWKLLPLQGL